ncbi:hypothetical protein GPECTOR_18g56 [Gonium pectorale]|uniref:Mediator of RNA polymerase II transcription subunit 4 n=1 Tax=Gonium pectorale TaxID=33097 RepID=A0A150GJS6_GONPE|nr:hypothetical protein GPECTOR_18g56 [Gonium pectorale]|eukprot:KXZ50078.1 hypothetical protein GPECTOR_18g56 [Gonium pectorale]
MGDRPLHVLASGVSAACAKLQASLADDVQPASTHATTTCGQHPSVAALADLIREHQELLARLNSSEAPARTDERAEVAAVAAKRERVLAQGLNALGAMAVSMRAVIDDVAELAPADNGYLPTVQELVAFGHRLRYTTFATTGLYSGEPAPQQLHFECASLWEHKQRAEAAAAAAAAAGGPSAPPPVDPRAEAACRTLLDNLIPTGWVPSHGLPEPVVVVLSDMPGAIDFLNWLVEERFGGGVGAPAAVAQPPDAATGAAGVPQAAEAPALPVAAAAAAARSVATAAPPAAPVNPSQKLALMLDDDSEEGSEEDEDDDDDDDD